jgi:hypothetical protein
MLPIPTIYDLNNLSLADSVLRTQSTRCNSSRMLFSNIYDISGSDFCTTRSFSRVHPALGTCVHNVFSVRSDKKMIRPHAQFVCPISVFIKRVTRVADAESFGNWSIGHFPGEPVRQFKRASVIKSTVTIARRPRYPKPAGVGLIGLRPKPGNHQIGNLSMRSVPSQVFSQLTINVPKPRVRRMGTLSFLSAPASTQLYRGRCGSRRILSQYGEWHFAHTFGLSGRRGHQRCPQRLHRTSRISGRIDNSILLTSSLVNSQLVAG